MGSGIWAMPVKVLTGVFDPPPESLSIPWGCYLALLAGAAIASVVVAVLTMKKRLQQPVMDELRAL